MAFVKRTWLARLGAGLNKFIIGAVDGQGKQTLINSPDSVSQQGDVISADNLNELENRINDAFVSADADIATKVPKTTTVNGKALTGNISLTYSDVGAVPDTRTVNNKQLNANITLSASDVGAVPTTRTVNGKPLSTDISLTASDVGAVAVDDTGWVELYNDHASTPTIVKYRRLNGFVTIIGSNVWTSMSSSYALPQNCRPVQTMRFFVPIGTSYSSVITSGYRLVEVDTSGIIHITTGSYSTTVSFTFTFPAG